jgi:hypothetical protein
MSGDSLRAWRLTAWPRKKATAAPAMAATTRAARLSNDVACSMLARSPSSKAGETTTA